MGLVYPGTDAPPRLSASTRRNCDLADALSRRWLRHRRLLNVDPRYGTLGDFIEFTHGAKQRGIRVLIDLVVNHTSDQHPWFKQARSDPNSKYRNWYVWSTKRPKQASKGMVFPGVQKTTWTYDR